MIFCCLKMLFCKLITKLRCSISGMITIGSYEGGKIRDGVVVKMMRVVDANRCD